VNLKLQKRDVSYVTWVSYVTTVSYVTRPLKFDIHENFSKNVSERNCVFT